MKRVIYAAGALTLFLTACDKDDDDQVTAQDTTFVTMAGVSNNAEIKAGQLASTKGNTPMVKAFGNSMVTEHNAAQTDLKNRASNAGLTAPDTVDADTEL